MQPNPAICTPRGIVALTGILLAVYLVWIGPERFYYESFGTWIVSPAIYPRLLPSPLKGWLLKVLVGAPWTCFIVQAIPVFLLLGALSAAIVSILKDSVSLAFTAMTVIGVVFGVYHVLQPLGITFGFL